jgi:hypothetical protein
MLMVMVMVMVMRMCTVRVVVKILSLYSRSAVGIVQNAEKGESGETTVAHGPGPEGWGEEERAAGGNEAAESETCFAFAAEDGWA